MEWLRTIFDPQTRDKASNEPRVLLMDGHNSHFSLAFLEYCIANNIVVICYPAHCTHALQGLDVVCFAKMKRIWHAELDEHYKNTGTHVNKQTYARVFGTAFEKAFDSETIFAAFRATGVHPFDPHIITEQQMKPSEVTSTRSTFPLPMPSPVRCVIAAYYQNLSEPHTNQVIEDRPFNLSGTLQLQSSPQTPTRTQSHPSRFTVGPSLFTPSKRARDIYEALESSQSGSRLITRPRLDSLVKPITPVIERQPHLPEPDWSLAGMPTRPVEETPASPTGIENDLLRKNLRLAHAQIRAAQAINEAANAQLIIQHIQASQMNLALHAKDSQSKRKKDERFGADGKGVVYTSADVIEIKRRSEEETQLKDAEKAARAALRARIRDARARIDEEWKEMKRVHTERLSEWKAETAQLKVQKVPRKQWPAAPGKPKKPKLPPELCRQVQRDTVVEEEGGSIDSDDDNNDVDGD